LGPSNGRHADASVTIPQAIIYVGNGGKQAKEDFCMLSIVDTARRKKVGDIELMAPTGKAMAVEHSGPRMFSICTTKPPWQY